jgi:phage I-like protein
MQKMIATALNMTEIPLTGGQVPEWVALIPAGEVIGRDGRQWVNNRPSGIIQAFIARGIDLPVDIEHSTELKAPNGDMAPAVGWVRELKEIGGAVWGRIEWNETGRQMVSTKSYRYLSPVIRYRETHGEIIAVTSVALTNRPNMDLPALNHQGATGSRVSSVIGLNATEKDICAKMGVSEEDYLKTALSTGDQSATSSLNATERSICAMMGVSEEEYLQTRL